jgi:capsule polysaccharide export protein KpsE/RkpR
MSELAPVQSCPVSLDQPASATTTAPPAGTPTAATPSAKVKPGNWDNTIDELKLLVVTVEDDLRQLETDRNMEKAAINADYPSMKARFGAVRAFTKEFNTDFDKLERDVNELMSPIKDIAKLEARVIENVFAKNDILTVTFAVEDAVKVREQIDANVCKKP